MAEFVIVCIFDRSGEVGKSVFHYGDGILGLEGFGEEGWCGECLFDEVGGEGSLFALAEGLLG